MFINANFNTLILDLYCGLQSCILYEPVEKLFYPAGKLVFVLWPCRPAGSCLRPRHGNKHIDSLLRMQMNIYLKINHDNKHIDSLLRMQMNIYLKNNHDNKHIDSLLRMLMNIYLNNYIMTTIIRFVLNMLSKGYFLSVT